MAIGRKREDKKSLRRDSRREAAAKAAAARAGGGGALAAGRGFLQGVVQELKKVHWPGRREVSIYTAVVFVAVVLVGAILWIFDLVLGQILIRILT